ncbi:MAG: tRNA (guanosine(37)-N1)-methyltransferase TrmD [Flavobacteriaceae bacterium]|nr:tRNA (guanosine(37)-N1)-methyltransferase TrmD [Flavobacteriaceae bacterium]|tara:strand:+ start:19801 stop:20478 length:678 start_codon:yes stop_codon:yes gene_type:complete
MNIDIITLFPELLDGPFNASIIKKAINAKLIEINFHNLRDYSSNKKKQVDDYQYGGGPGMVMMIEPIAKCIKKLKSKKHYDDVIYLTPDGKKLNQSISNELSNKNSFIILCGHYKGIDQRVRDLYITREISIGDFVLSGGELAAAVLCDSVIRLIPGVLGDESSALYDSFQDNILAPPIYTRPSEYDGLKVPDILLSGDKNKIDIWREEKSIERTKKIRPDLLEN